MRTILVSLLATLLLAAPAIAETGSVHATFASANDGTTPAYVTDKGGDNVTLAYDTDAGTVTVVDGPAHYEIARGVAAAVGFVSDGAQGGFVRVGVAVNGSGCSFSTESGEPGCDLP